MLSLPHWDGLSQAAQALLLASVQAMLDADLRTMPRVSNDSIWDELVGAGVVLSLPDANALYLTGPGTCLVLDVLEVAYSRDVLVAA